MKLEKVCCMNVAAQLAGAVIGNLPDDLKVDVDVRDANLRAENLMAWELFRIFYHAAAKALDDEQNWPSPKETIDVATLIGSAAETLVPGGLAALPPLLAPVIRELLDKLKSAAPTPFGPLPNPGEPRGPAQAA